jgi:hypothetical protein
MRQSMSMVQSNLGLVREVLSALVFRLLDTLSDPLHSSTPRKASSTNLHRIFHRYTIKLNLTQRKTNCTSFVPPAPQPRTPYSKDISIPRMVLPQLDNLGPTHAFQSPFLDILLTIDIVAILPFGNMSIGLIPPLVLP